MDQDNSLGLFEKLSFHLIKHLSKFLTAKEAFELSLTNISIYDTVALKMKSVQIQKQEESYVRDNGIELYLELDISKYGHKAELIVVDVMTKDQGWASASYSTSWVSLQLFNDPNEVQNHIVQENEQIIHENYRQEDFVNRHLFINYDEIPLTDAQKKKNQVLKKKSVLHWIRKGQFQKLGIVQKCQYPGWECYINKAQITLWYREN